MAEVTHRVTIARPPEEVFAALTDVDRLPEWQETCLSVTREGDGPIGLGSTWVERRRVIGPDRDVNVEVKELDSPRLLVLAINASPVKVAIRHELTPVAEGTALMVEVSGGEGIPRLMRGMAVRMVGNQAAGDFDRLKTRLEAAAKA